MKDFVIFDSDGQELFDAMTDDFVASVEKVGNFAAVALKTNDFKFCGGVYDTHEKAQQEIHQLLKAVTKAKCGKNNVEGYELSNSDISATELLDSIFDCRADLQEDSSDAEKDFYATEQIDGFIDELEKHLLSLRWKNLRRMKKAGDKLDRL